MTNFYEIEKPITDVNYLTIAIKYTVLFILLFLVSWIAIPLLVLKRSSSGVHKVAEFLFENVVLSSLVISIGILSWFIYRIIKKYKKGEVFKIEFNDAEQKLGIKTINLVNNQERDNLYEYKNVRYNFYESTDLLFGKQRIVCIMNTNKVVHTINIDRTAWCRNEQLDELIEKMMNSSL
ncbi:hypothetical protein ACQY1Q_00950 [Tenacibaculum sp. TC6]|uniref:hypothetical protein n=1 Tax=Tenacibaculum sp. TC6 TaxID=3423223 RepID=UPI003D36708A